MNLPDWIIRFLQATAWPMKAPAMVGPFHIGMMALCIAVPYLAVRLFPCSRVQARRRLFLIGIVLAVMEIYKQLFYYAVVNHMHYDWWFFPFQLCSMAMYLCLILPLTRGRLRDAIQTFLFDFSLPGALLALWFPEDMLRPYWTMTLHGFLWHGLLVYIAFMVYQAGLVRNDRRGFLDAAGLYLILAATAFLLNVWFTPLAVYGSRPNLFYLSPHEKTGQFFFRRVADAFGIGIEHIVYVSMYILFCACFHWFAVNRGR